MQLPAVDSMEQLIAVTLQLGALEVAGISRSERSCTKRVAPVSPRLVSDFRASILRGLDPLGEAFSSLRAPAERRPLGATYTPYPIVSAMTGWVASQQPVRIVDPGAGSGRFIVAAGRALPKATLTAVEIDPVAALMLRANLKVTGLAQRARVFVGDYRNLQLPHIQGRTAFLGNPPYVRHHQISPDWKQWLVDSAVHLGLPVSKLAGLHIHFFVATAQKSQAGDIGAFVTAAEWLDVNYGELLRKLLLGTLGLSSLQLIEPTAKPFSDADTTAVVTYFGVGQQLPSVRVRRIQTLAQLGAIDRGQEISRERLERATRWTSLTRITRTRASGTVELGELCRVHRGQVTGANRVWIAGPHSSGLPKFVLYPAITRARELFAAGQILEQLAGLRCVIDVPPDLDRVPKRHLPAIEQFLRRARSMGADKGYIASHRPAWWSVGLREPAPILATYMARRAPAFVLNAAAARHINIAHGIYPRDPMSPKLLSALVQCLRTSVSVEDGRMYSGGLAKFEPKEMERLLVPEPALLGAAFDALAYPTTSGVF